ncbi:hypothetical protein SO802_031323 [Lithocarpus litseifolius]|uniref:Uncharacterized protein n=1 Tax=Lithocarpus litseifolius TaxID=425828 RepID=A0AAW2BMK2_9ROSI
MAEEGEHLNTEEPMNIQELLNTMVASQIQLREDMNCMVQQFQNLKGFPEPRFDLVTKTLVPGFELLLECNNKVPKSKKEETTWVPSYWVDYMDPEAMTTFLRDAICNIKDEDGNDWGEPPSDREDEDADLFYEEFDDDVDYYDQDIEDDIEANRWSDTDSDQYILMNVLENTIGKNQQANNMYHEEYPYGHLSDWSSIIDVSSRSSLITP